MLRSDLVHFMRKHGMPSLLDGAPERARIGVVDDDPLIVSTLLRVLRRVAPGAECRSAHDGFSAGAMLASFRPDLIFLDVIMPGLSGIDVCEYIRATPELTSTKVVVVSAHLSHVLRSRLSVAGVDGFIAKPFTTVEIDAALLEHFSPERLACVVNREAAAKRAVARRY